MEWSKLCALCQEKLNQNTSCPAKLHGEGCKVVGQLLQTIREKKMTYPFDVSYDLLDEGEGFEQTLTSHKAWYHKYCRIK